jgi:hypothetical protein
MNEAFGKSCFDAIGLVALRQEFYRLKSTSRTAVYGTVRTVV